MLRVQLTGNLQNQSVPLAFLRGPDLNPKNQVSVADLGYKIPENLVSFRSVPFAVESGIEVTSEDGEVTLAHVIGNEIDSSNIIATNKVRINRSISTPSPLFYKYTIGRGRYFIYTSPSINMTSILEDDNGVTYTNPYIDFLNRLSNSEPLNEDDLVYLKKISDSIFSDIKVATHSGRRTSISYQIANIKPISIPQSSSHFGKVFAADVYVSEKNKNGITNCISYNAYDIGTNEVLTGKTEVINAEPISPVTRATYRDGYIIRVTADEDISSILT